MTDLELTRLCAEAMGFTVHGPRSHGIDICFDPEAHAVGVSHRIEFYDPFNYDAQAMALVKKFELNLIYGDEFWIVEGANGEEANHTDLNHAICEVVAQMQAAKVVAAGTKE